MVIWGNEACFMALMVFCYLGEVVSLEKETCGSDEGACSSNKTTFRSLLQVQKSKPSVHAKKNKASLHHRRFGAKLPKIPENFTEADVLDATAAMLDQSYGMPTRIYRECLHVVSHASTTEKTLSSLDRLASMANRCKREQFKLKDTRFLAIECDRLERQLLLQQKIWDAKALDKDERICALLVNVVLPIDDEPDCMRLIEDISHMHITKNVTGRHNWPAIIHEPQFPSAFMQVCTAELAVENKKQSKESEDEITKTCRRQLGEVVALHGQNITAGLPLFLSKLCPLLNKPLPHPSYINKVSMTHRGAMVQVFRRASSLAHEQKAESMLVARAGAGLKDGVRTVLEHSLATKGKALTKLSDDEEVACAQEAYTESWDISFSGGFVTFGYSLVLKAFGFYDWEGNDAHVCEFTGISYCTSMSVGDGFDFSMMGVSFTQVHGYYTSVHHIAGKSVVTQASGTFVFGALGAGVVKSEDGEPIGVLLEKGFGFGLGVSYSHMNCEMIPHGEKKCRRIKNLKPRCPGASEQRSGPTVPPVVYKEPIPFYVWAGCYWDDGYRDLKHGPKKYGYTVATCRAFAESHNYKYFALQNNGYCSADNSFATGQWNGLFQGTSEYLVAPLSKCGDKCMAEKATGPTLKCGGNWVNAIYETKFENLPERKYAMIGCHADDNHRDLRNGPGAATKGYTVATCQRWAASRKYAYFALQSDGECFADNTYGFKYSSANFAKDYKLEFDSSKCGKECTDETAEAVEGTVLRCGGHLFNAIYLTNPNTPEQKLLCLAGIASRNDPMCAIYLEYLRQMSSQY